MQEVKSEKPHGLDVNGVNDNIMRILAMLEKALNRVIRRNYFDRSQYPQFVLDVETTLNALRLWISRYRLFACLENFSYLVALAVQKLTIMIGELVEKCTPSPGKKKEKKRVSSFFTKSLILGREPVSQSQPKFDQKKKESFS